MRDLYTMADVYDVRNFEYFKYRDLSYAFDALTGVLMREEVTEYVRHLLESGVPFTFAIVDVDNFKTVNDTYGHIKGDSVLAVAAGYLCEKLGPRGIVGRFGGDEFMMVLEGVTDYKDIWDIGHDINMNIGALKFPGIKGLSITVTMGISRSPVDGKTYDGLLALADKALYRGKMKGRNCFIIYLPEKHRDIDITKSRDNRYTTAHLCSRVFGYLTGGDGIEEGMALLFRQFVAYFMVDHICVETRRGINFQVIHPLAKNKTFEHIDYAAVGKYFNNIGLAYFNKVEELTDGGDGVVDAMRAQHVSSALYCRISAFGRDYGYIRVDMTDTVRIWQQTEMDILIVAANAIGVLLHYQGKTLDEMPLQEVFVMSGEG